MRIVRYLAPGGRGPAVGILDGEQIAEIPATGVILAHYSC